ncbi:CHAT domain-containing protein [Streptomyces sp. NPDC096205]|uniref:CHAT domain-containing protein n=1 Tax=Streptomyces sp. NPDC096205 TaxID=3366081 RepID=UPI00380007B1
MLFLRSSLGGEYREIGEFLLRPGALPETRTRLQVAVNRLRRSLRFALEPGWDDVEAGLSGLYEAGLGALGALFGGQMPEFVTTMQQLMPAAGVDLEDVPSIQFHCDKDAVFPIELLPVFRLMEPRPPIVNDQSLDENVGRYLGFATNVRRHIRGAPVTAPPVCRRGDLKVSCLPNESGLKVALFHEASLTETAAEKLDLQRHGSRLSLLGPWPSGDVGSLEKIIAEILRESCPPGQLDAHVLHFACHCMSDVESPADITIRLRGTQTDRIEVTLGNLEARSAILSLMRNAGAASAAPILPLVFLNACSSAVVEPLTGASLPNFFQDQGYIGFIGTEAPVPDAVAAAFSKEFYRCFLAGQSLGEALRNSRRALLYQYKNPLGLIYVAYADGDIRVAQPVSEEIPG